MPDFSAGVRRLQPSMMMEASFEKLLVLLAKGGVRFVVVGGVAVAIQGYVRLTEDEAPTTILVYFLVNPPPAVDRVNFTGLGGLEALIILSDALGSSQVAVALVFTLAPT